MRTMACQNALAASAYLTSMTGGACLGSQGNNCHASVINFLMATVRDHRAGTADSRANVALVVVPWINRRLDLAQKKLKLSVIMAAFFVCLSLPILIFILAYNDYRQSQVMMATLKDDVDKTRQASIENVENMIRGVAGTLRLLAEVVAADPDFFRADRSREVLFRVLTSAEEIDAAFVSFEDGYHRAVTRIDDDRRRSDPNIPLNANWHMNFVDDYRAGPNRSRHRTFFNMWGHVVGEYAVPTTVDYRVISGYPAAKASGVLAVADPEINSDTGYPIINMRFPVFYNGNFIGCVGASITLDVLTRFLATHRASPHSTTIIADPTDGEIIAASEKQKSVRSRWSAMRALIAAAILFGLCSQALSQCECEHLPDGTWQAICRSPRDVAPNC